MRTEAGFGLFGADATVSCAKPKVVFPLVVEQVKGINVVRDDLVPGGTKRRVIPFFLTGADEFVYASPVSGYAQVALAYACRDTGALCVVFTAARKTRHARTLEAVSAGARVVEVSPGYLSNVQCRAREYVAGKRGRARLLPFGFDTPLFGRLLADEARRLPFTPSEVWTVAGSGTLSRALQVAWPSAVFVAVQVGRPPNVGSARLLRAAEAFDADAEELPPFPSCANYDAKAWAHVRRFASPGALFWNVAG